MSVSRASVASFLALLAPVAAAAQRPQLPIAIEQRFATAAHLNVGDSVMLRSPANEGDASARVVAIFAPQADPSTIMRRDYHIRLHLADLAGLIGQPDRVDRMGVVLQPGVDADSAVARLNLTAFGYDVLLSRKVAAESSTTFMVVSRFHRAIGFISILASTIFMLCLMLLKVDSRRRDVAVLRFTGISRRTVFVSLVLEATVIAVVGSIVGIGIAAVASRTVNAHYQHAFDTSLVFSQVTGPTLILAVSISIVLGIGAGSIAAWRMVHTPPVELWSRAA